MGQAASKAVRTASSRVASKNVDSAVKAATTRSSETSRVTAANTPPPPPATAPSGPTEMPPDLLQFLNDAGPLKEADPKVAHADDKPDGQNRKLPKRFSSIMQSDEDSGKSVMINSIGKSANHRDATRQRLAMPLAEQIEGYDTMRTHSFSTKPDQEDPHDFGLDVLELYQLLRRKPEQQQSLHEFYQDFVQKKNIQTNQENEITCDESSSSSGPAVVWSQREQEEHMSLLEQSMDVLELPVVLKDTDDSYVGASALRVPDLEFMKLTTVPKSSVQLVLEDLVERQQEEEQ